MYGANLDFSGVLLPGTGGSLNAATAITSDKLQEMNRSGKKWGIDKETGNLTFHNEATLKANQKTRSNRENLINRDRDAHSDGQEAMKEIFGRKKARMEAFREIKKKEYNFADDTEMMSMPQPFSHKEAKGCSASCKGPGKCSCDSCKKSLYDSNYREWSTKKREKLQKGEIKGEFAGKGMSFPIASPKDVAAAWASVGRTENPQEVMANIIRISKKFGWESGLPQTVRDRLNEGKSGLPSTNFREWSSDKRKKLSEGDLRGEFAGPGMSFPISSAEDVSAAWSSVGRAANPRKVMAEIIRIAKKFGWESGLPETVKQRLNEGKSGLPE